MNKGYRYIYGPVPSWRLGSSLGIDPISQKNKVCTFDCVYCQLGRTKSFSQKRKVFVPTAKITKELGSLPPVKIDYITFSGRGEPTLAGNLGRIIKAVRRARKEKIAVLTNSSLMDREDVGKDLSLADLVVCKLDASSQYVFKTVNVPMEGFNIETIIDAIKEFRNIYKGKLALQIMFIEDNRRYAGQIAGIAKYIGPDEVQLNTPLRTCGIRPLTKYEMETIKKSFNPLNVVSVYSAEKRYVKPISSSDTLRRRGKI